MIPSVLRLLAVVLLPNLLYLLHPAVGVGLARLQIVRPVGLARLKVKSKRFCIVNTKENMPILAGTIYHSLIFELKFIIVNSSECNISITAVRSQFQA